METLSQKELLYLVKILKVIFKNKILLKKTDFLNNLGLSIILSDLDKEQASAYWVPKNKLIKIDQKAIEAGSLTFARIINHEMIHIAQSCKGGSISSLPELIGLNEK